MKTYYVAENKDDCGEWHDAFKWQPAFDNREEAEDDLTQWLCDMAMQTGMDTNPNNYRIVEVLI
jgi:hypothetical protein